MSKRSNALKSWNDESWNAVKIYLPLSTYVCRTTNALKYNKINYIYNFNAICINHKYHKQKNWHEVKHVHRNFTLQKINNMKLVLPKYFTYQTNYSLAIFLESA